MNNLPDIYFEKKWGELYSFFENGDFNFYHYKSQFGEIYYPFVKKKIHIEGFNDEYFDISSPYGFNGPIILKNNGNKEKLVDDFNNKFQIFCNDNNIVSEYIRFSPWLKNSVDFSSLYSLMQRKNTLAIDLSVDSLINDEIHQKRRNLIRKSQKMDVYVEFDFVGEHISEFIQLYKYTVLKNNISSYYELTEKFLKDNFLLLKGHILIVSAKKNDEVISSAVFLYNGTHIHYHYSANNYEKIHLNGNSLILYEVAEWAKKNNMLFLHLGGATKSLDLFKFKQSFTKSSGYAYFVGTKIRNSQIYDKLVLLSGKKNTEFFPKYRG